MRGKRRVGRGQPTENRIHFSGQHVQRLAGQRAPLQLQRAAVRVAAQFPSALDQGRVQRCGTQPRMPRAGLQPRVEVLERKQHAPHVQNRVDAFGRPAAMSRAPGRVDLRPLEPLVRDGDVEVGGLGDDAGIGSPPCDERIGADARVLFVHDACHHDPSGRQTARRGHDAHGVDHGCNPALHVLRASAVQPPILFDRDTWRGHAGHADRVGMPAQHQRAARGAAFKDGDYVGPARRHFLHLDVQADGLEFLHQPPGDLAFARCAWHQGRVH